MEIHSFVRFVRTVRTDADWIEILTFPSFIFATSMCHRSHRRTHSSYAQSPFVHFHFLPLQHSPSTCLFNFSHSFFNQRALILKCSCWNWIISSVLVCCALRSKDKRENAKKSVETRRRKMTKKNGKKWYKIDARKVSFVSASPSLTVLHSRCVVYRSTSEKKRTVNALEWREKCTEKKHMFAESSHLWGPVHCAVCSNRNVSVEFIHNVHCVICIRFTCPHSWRLLLCIDSTRILMQANPQITDVDYPSSQRKIRLFNFAFKLSHIHLPASFNHSSALHFSLSFSVLSHSLFLFLSRSFFLINVMQTTRGQKTIIKIEFRLHNLSVPHIRSSLHSINTLCLHLLFIAAKNHMWLKNEDQQYCDLVNEEQRKNERKK